MSHADDMIIKQSAKTSEELSTELIFQLDSMSNWFYKNKLPVNTSKTEIIFFGNPVKVEKSKNMESVIFQGSNIDSRDKIEYLGVIFDEAMTWEKQANKARKNVYSNLIKIKKITSLIDNRTKHLLLKCLT